MDAGRWRDLQAIFMTARALEGDERERLLAARASGDPELVAQIRALLAADAEPGVMDVLAPRLASVAHVLSDAVPARVGPYRIVREIGRGGMGVVYLAERADGEFDQQVAVKLIATGDAADARHRRFLAERQILAGLVHPNIARLLDGGLTEDGRPYLALEYVDGLPITTYCDELRLDVPARLRLFADVCAAVQHAHQKLVIHRDLKPSNILVSTDGRVHLLDFGIAKLIEPAPAARAPATHSEWRMMTPEYASPEQVRGEALSTASDIYALGVLLYELLCGCRPYELKTGSPVDVAAAVCEQDPERPSARVRRGDAERSPEVAAELRGTSADRLSRRLAGDLDGIVLMAMRKEPGRRYASADMLRQDLDRHLAGLPVLAHRGSRRYRAAKFLRRHRGEALAALLVLAVLVAGLSLAVHQAQRAARERDRAEQALAESNGVTTFLLDLFRAGDGTAPPTAELTAMDLLQRGAQRADELQGQPVAHARLLDVIGQMLLHLGRHDEAQRRLEQAVAIRRTLPAEASLDLASSLIHLARVHRTRSEYARAQDLVTEAIEIRRRLLPAGHPDVADALHELGWLAAGPSQERIYREALALLADTPATAERRVRLLQALSTNLRRQGRLGEAVAASREALTVAERWFGPEHHATGSAMIQLADHMRDIEQDLAAAERLYRRGLDALATHYGPDSTRLLHGLNSLARLLGSRGDGEAEQINRRALALSQSATGPEHPQVAEQFHQLAGELARQGRLAEAEALSRQAIDLSIRTLGPRHHTIGTSRLPLLARILDLSGRHEEADRTYSQVFDHGLSGVLLGELHREYGSMLLTRGDLARAEEHLQRSRALLEDAYRASGVEHPNVQETKRALMELYQRQNRPELVERYRVPPGRFVPY